MLELQRLIRDTCPLHIQVQGWELTLHAFTLISYLSSSDFVFNIGVSCHWLTYVDLFVWYRQCCFMENFIQLIDYHGFYLDHCSRPALIRELWVYIVTISIHSCFDQWLCSYIRIKMYCCFLVDMSMRCLGLSRLSSLSASLDVPTIWLRFRSFYLKCNI